MSTRIGFLGSAIRIKNIESIIETLFPDIDPIFIREDLAIYQESVALHLKELKPKLDAFVFSGELQHEFYSYIFSPDIPCEYLRKDWSSLQNAFLKISLLGIDFRSVSIDSYTQTSLQNVLKDLSIPESENHIHFIKRRSFHGDYLDQVGLEHLLLYKNKVVTGCVTALYPVYNRLLSEGIPCAYVTPTTETIIKSVQRVIGQLDLKKAQTGHTAFLIVRIIPKKEYSYIRKDEYLYMHEKIKVAEEVYYFARNTKAAVVSESSDQFTILMSKTDLLEYTQGYQCFYLIHSIHVNTNCDVNIGIGYGFDPSEAKHNASTAIERLDVSQKNMTYVVPKEGSVIGPLSFLQEENTPNPRYEESHFVFLSKETGISQTQLYELYVLMEKQKKQATLPTT